jgi:serpin B
MSEQVSTKVARSNAQFAFDVYHLLCQQSGNLFFSPSSIATTLAMAYAGARGETSAQMERVLHVVTEEEETHSGFAALESIIADIQEEGLVRLDSANSLWPQAAHPILADYLRLVERYYGTSVTPVDYSNGPAAARLINGWIEQHTKGHIRDLVPASLDPLTRLILVNAIYFRGKWLYPFDADFTDDARFSISRWRSTTVPMMRQTDEFRYAQVDGLQMLELPYAGQDLAMLVLLPESHKGIGSVEQRLSGDILQQWCELLQPARVQLSLPRFRMDRQFELSSVLTTLGLRDAFHDKRADFSGIDGGAGRLYISQVMHKAFVDVDEIGTEAAAATVLMEFGRSIFDRTKPVVFRADHPFLLAIRERSEGNILFLGRVSNPAK